MRFGEAIGIYIAHLARAGLAKSTRDGYFRNLCHFADEAGPRRDVATLELVDYERFVDRWTDGALSTLASGVSLATGFSRLLYERGLTATHVAEPLKRPRKKRPEDLNVTSISSEEGARMIEGCEDWQELLCVSTGLYMGARRGGLSKARLADVDFGTATVRFLEKGGKVAVKPMPDEYVAILRAAQENGVWAASEDYLIPNRRPAAVRRAERSDKVIWDTVKRVVRARRDRVSCARAPGGLRSKA
jgi:integrase